MTGPVIAATLLLLAAAILILAIVMLRLTARVRLLESMAHTHFHVVLPAATEQDNATLDTAPRPATTHVNAGGHA